MQHIRLTTEKLIKTWQGAEQKKMSNIVKRGLRKILTRQELRHIKSYYLKDSRIILGVDSSAWLYMLSNKKRQLLRGLNQVLYPEVDMTEIILRIDT